MGKLQKDIKDYYNKVAPVYHIKHGVGFYGCEWAVKKYYAPLIEKFIKKGSKILEIGCGTGTYTPY